MITILESKWFKTDLNHSLLNTEGAPVPHLFFDVTPEFSLDNKLVNVVMTTPQDSDHHYRLDIISGQRHYAHSYCAQNDVWNQQKGAFHRPPYSIGVIPRFLDQLGAPQKVIVFSNAEKVRSTLSYNFFRVRLVGAYVEKTCPEGECLERDFWHSRLVFLAVDPDDKRFQDIKDLPDFLKSVDWPNIKGHLENIDGRNHSGNFTYPYVRAGKPIPQEEAFAFFKKHSIFMSDKELKKVHGGCTALYDRLWTEVGIERPEDKSVNTMEELAAKVKLRVELKSKRVPVGFGERFKTFARKYYDEITTCNKFVYAGNFNRDPEKFWFLNYVNLYFQLHRDGYFYDCHHNSWQRNILNNRGQPIHMLKRDIEHCNEADIDQAMTHMGNFLEGLKGDRQDYYRFIDYDNHVFGTHNKLYSWVRLPAKQFDCSDNMNEKIRSEIKVFPEDVKWKSRRVDDIESKEKIIY